MKRSLFDAGINVMEQVLKSKSGPLTPLARAVYWEILEPLTDAEWGLAFRTACKGVFVPTPSELLAFAGRKTDNPRPTPDTSTPLPKLTEAQRAENKRRIGVLLAELIAKLAAKESERG